LVDDLTAPPARGTCHRPATRLRALSIATAARLHPGDLDVSALAEYRAFEINLEVVPEILPALGTVAAAASATEQVTESEEIPEDIAEIGKHGRIEPGCRHPLEAVVAVMIIGRALLGVGQDAIGLSRLFELVLGIRIVRIPVRMVLERHLAISAFELLLIRLPADPKDLVVVSFCHGI
jgi:hypothetical protein